MAKKKIPPEMRDIAEVVKRECKSFEDFLFKVRVERDTPYSRLSAIISRGGEKEVRTVRDACAGVTEDGKPVERELVEYVRGLGICGKKRIKIYRGGTPIRVGDWVTLEREYAEWYGPVYTKVVSPEDVIWSGIFVKEWFYVPKRLRGYFRDLREFWEAVKDA